MSSENKPNVSLGKAELSLAPFDHRELNKEHEYYHFDEAIGAGLPLWLPAGVVLRDELEKLMRELEFIGGYQRVVSPHIAKEDLYSQSGHLDHYAESMFPAMEFDNVKYRLRPMCCPHHHKMFSARLRSYRELPLRLAEYGQVYRYELSGALSGLMRVRGLCQNDAHLYCRPAQVKEEIKKVLLMYQEAYKVLGISKYELRLSKWDPADPKNKYVANPEKWEWAEKLLREILVENNLPFVEAEGEAAFYGPKIDVQIEYGNGKSESASTVQLDFMSAERFDLEYINEAGERERPIIIHRAPLGSHERFVALLIEHFKGAFPLWLAPEQLRVIPIGDRHHEHAEKVRLLLHNSFMRVSVDNRVESLSKKIAEAHAAKVSNILVIGDREVQENLVSWQQRSSREKKNINPDELKEILKIRIANRE